MNLEASNLIHLAELIKLSAVTARAFTDGASTGNIDKIVEAADRIDAAAEDLLQASREMDRAPEMH